MSQENVLLPLPVCKSGCRTDLVRRGHFFRKSDRSLVQRFHCRECLKSCSQATFSACFRQKKRHFNPTIFHLLAGGFSLRRTAFDLRINRKTVTRKFIFLGLAATAILKDMNRLLNPVSVIQFDELETSEHTKLKPLSVPIVCEEVSRWILGFRVCEMPAKGKIAHLSRKKYGRRRDERTAARLSLFREIEPFLASDALIKSDDNPHYLKEVREIFGAREYRTFKSKRARVVGQGELKKGGFDPIFKINHTLAMLRANMNRLFRKTWCTTKKKERLALHLAIYACKHNLLLIDQKKVPYAAAI